MCSSDLDGGKERETEERGERKRVKVKKLSHNPELVKQFANAPAS